MFNENENEPAVKKKKITSLSSRKGVTDDRFRGVDSSSIVKINDSFKDREFCVMIEMGNEDFNKKQLEKGIGELGGEFVQNPTSNTHCIIASKLTHKLQAYVKNDAFDIVKPGWLLKCIEHKRYIEFKPSDMWHTKANTKILIGKCYDCYGDSYVEDSTVESLKSIFKNMDTVTEVDQSNRDTNPDDVKRVIAYIENKYFPDECSNFGLFRLINAYLDVYEVAEDESKPLKYSYLDLFGLKILWRGGFIHKKVNENTTHCIVDKK